MALRFIGCAARVRDADTVACPAQCSKFSEELDPVARAVDVVIVLWVVVELKRL